MSDCGAVIFPTGISQGGGMSDCSGVFFPQFFGQGGTQSDSSARFNLAGPGGAESDSGAVFVSFSPSGGGESDSGAIVGIVASGGAMSDMGAWLSPFASGLASGGAESDSSADFSLVGTSGGTESDSTALFAAVDPTGGAQSDSEASDSFTGGSESDSGATVPTITYGGLIATTTYLLGGGTAIVSPGTPGTVIVGVITVSLVPGTVAIVSTIASGTLTPIFTATGPSLGGFYFSTVSLYEYAWGGGGDTVSATTPGVVDGVLAVWLNFPGAFRNKPASFSTTGGAQPGTMAFGGTLFGELEVCFHAYLGGPDLPNWSVFTQAAASPTLPVFFNAGGSNWSLDAGYAINVSGGGLTAADFATPTGGAWVCIGGTWA